MSRHFAVDLGAESGRCIVGELIENQLTMRELSRFPTGALALQGGLYWNVYRFYEEIIKGLKLYVQTYGPELDSIGIDTWGVDFGLLGPDGHLHGLPYCYRDQRTEGSEALLAQKMEKSVLYNRTGIQFLTFNTLNQLVSAKSQGDPSLDDATGLLFIADLLHYLLGAKACCEYTAASISQLVHIHEKNWDPEIFQAYDLPDRLKMPIAFAGDRIGTLSDEIAALTGLDKGVTIVTPAVHDTASAAAAVPGMGKNWGYISSGTWSLAGVELDQPVVNPASFAMNISNSGGAFDKVLFLKNIMGLWIIQQCRSSWLLKRPELTYNEIEQEAANCQPSGAFIDPDHPDFFAPGQMPQRVCDFVCRTQNIRIDPDDIGTVAKLVFDSLALKYRFVFESICQATGARIDSLNIVGGGSKNHLLNQLTANAMQIPVHAGPSECTAMGNLLIQAYGCKQIQSQDELREIVRNSSEIVSYTPENETYWQLAYSQFKNLCQRGEKG